MRALLLAIATVLLAPAAAGAQISETLSVPTGDGDRIHVEIQRPATLAPVPVILTYSPYNVLAEGTLPNLANDSLGQRYVPRGYARAVADVLGTRNSSGCWDYGGESETRSGVDLVNALAKLPWSNGKVAMIGGSYDGTTANMVASAGAAGLAAIVPEAAISRWYGYAYSDGVRYLGNSQYPTDEGFDTPLAFDFGFGRTPPTQVTPQLVDALSDRTNPCDSAEHTARGYDTSPDYDDFWVQRDYRRDYDVPALIVHGWQDFNVRQSEGIDLFAAQDGFTKLYVFQGAHEMPSDANFQPLLDAFFEHTLKGVDNGIESQPPVLTEGSDGVFREETSWPPPGTTTRTIELPEGKWTETGTSNEETGEPYHVTETLMDDLRIAGAPVLHARVSVDAEHGHLTPTLVDVAPDGTTTPITRGFLNLRYRNGLEREEPVPPNTPVTATVTFSPQDTIVPAGHRVGLILAGSNAVWAVPDQPAGQTFRLESGSRLELPAARP
jgi:X-Pro dipeptidyl-peptidase